MAIINTGSLGTGSAPSTSSTTAVITLPENCLVFLDVMTNAATPATPTLSGTGGETWVSVGTRTTTQRRITRFRTMVSNDTATTVTIDAGATQLQIGWAATYYGGVNVGGTHGSAAVGQIWSTDSGGANGTQLDLTLAVPADVRNAVSAAYASGANADSVAQGGWTEVVDFTVSASSANRLQVQFLAHLDAIASSSGAFTVRAVIACEIIAATDAVCFEHVYTFSSTSAGLTQLHPVPTRKGRVYIAQLLTATTSSASIAAPGVTFTLDQTFATSGTARKHYVWRFKPDVDGVIGVRVTRTLTGTVYQFNVIEVSNYDDQVGGGHGIVQSKTATTTGTNGQLAITPNSAVSDDSAMLIIAVGAQTTMQTNGWQTGYGPTTDSGGAIWRSNGDSAPSININALTVPGGGIVYEFQAAQAAGADPVIALVSPAEGAIDVDDDVVIDVTDADNDLTFVTITAHYPNVAGGLTEEIFSGVPDVDAFEPAFVAGSSDAAVTDGFRFTLNRGGWPDSEMTIEVVAIDASGNVTVESYDWTIADVDPGIVGACPEGEPPALDLVSPPASTEIATNAALVVDVTDPDDDLDKVVFGITFTNLGVTEEVWRGSSFFAPYLGSSVANITDGKRFTIVRSGGWGGALTLGGLAFDVHGNDTAASWSWTVDLDISDEEEDSALAIGGTERGRDINIDATLNDFTLTAGGDLALVAGVPSIVQAIRQALRMFRGEWFLDEALGVPWLDRPEQSVVGILGQKNPSIPAIREVVRDAILAVPGVLDIVSLDVSLDRTTRRLSISFRVSTDEGELVETVAISEVR